MASNKTIDEKIIVQQQPTLSTLAKKLIDDHLFSRVLKYLTALTLVGALGIYAYISTLKNNLSDEIKESIMSEISTFRSETYVNVADARRDVKEATKIIEIVKKRAKVAEDNLLKAEQFASVAKEAAEEIAKYLLTNKKFKSDVTNSVAKLDFENKNIEIGMDIIAPNNKWGEGDIVGYGTGAHIWTNKQAMCPDGMFVAGIKVIYRGTCQNQCSKDGGIIGDIQLICKKL